MLIWVPTAEVAAGLAGLPGAEVEVVAPDGAPLPPSVDRVEFHVPPFFPAPPGIEAMSRAPTVNYPWSMPYGRVTDRRAARDVSRWTPFLNRSVTGRGLAAPL